jgi:S1-C subfamily serine protease
MKPKALIGLLILTIILAGLAFGQRGTKSQAVSHKSNQAETKASPQELFKRLAPSVVVIEVLDVNNSVVGRASGVVVRPNLVVTNRHVVDAGEIWIVKQGDKTSRAFLIWIDPDHDLAQLKADRLDASPTALRLSSTLAVGERVYAIGSPRGLELTFSEGLISGLRKYENGQVIQTSAAISPGSSGGGLFDAQGRLVGITSFSLTESQNLNFALPVEWVQVLQQSQTPANQPQSTIESEETFSGAAIASNNMQTMVFGRRLSHDRTYTYKPHNAASWLITKSTLECIKDGKSPDCDTNWPLWRRASLHMLQLREDIQSAQPVRDEIEKASLDAAKSAWSTLAKVYCKDKPSSFYTDLDDKIRSCANIP